MAAKSTTGRCDSVILRGLVDRRTTVNHFKVLLRGENFLIRFEGRATRVGFYATRFVEAKSREAAELLAVDLVRRDKEFRGILNERDDPPVIFADEIDVVEASEVESTAGYTFFLAGGDSAEESDA
jgi:hypothetical protein